MNISDYIGSLSRQVEHLKHFAVAAAVGDALESLLSRYRTIIIHANESLDEFDVSVNSPSGPLFADGPTLVDALMSCGVRKTCNSCKRDLPIISYSRDASKPDRRCSSCRECERARLKEFYRRKRGTPGT